MSELRPTRGVGFEQPSATERLERPVAFCGGELRHRGRDRRPEAASQNARGLRVSPLLGRRTDEPGAQERGLRGGEISTGLGEVPATPDACGYLLEQEGVAGCQPGCAPRRGRGDFPTGAIAQHLRGAGVAKRPQLLHGGFTVIGKRPNRIESALGPWPKGPDQGNRQIADPAAEEGKQRERVLVGPVKVIEQQQGR